MEITTREVSDAVVVLEIAGDIDIYNTGDLKTIINKVVEDGKKHIVFDMSQVPYIDSSGIGALIATLTKLKKAGGSLKIIRAHDSVKKVFELTKMTSFFEIYDSEEEAMEKI